MKDKNKNNRMKINSMKKHVVASVFLLMIVTASSVGLARNFIVYNVSNPSQTYFIVNGQTGYVGIGTNAPGYPLDVVGNARVTSNLIVSGYGNLGSLQIGGTEVIDNSRNLKNINAVAQSLIPSAHDTYDIGSDLVRWKNGYFSGDLYVSGTIHGNVVGSISSNGDLNMNGHNIYNANDVNATRFFQNGNQVVSTITAGNGLSGGGNGPSVTLNVNVNTAKGLQITGDSIETKIGTGLAYDGSGNIYVKFGSTSGTAVEGNKQITITAGSGLSGGGTITLGNGGSVTISHADTSNQGSVSNTGGTVIQSVVLDDYGHVTSLSSVNLDNRYYTQSAADSRFANIDQSETITGAWTFNNDVRFMKNIYIAGNISYVNSNTLNVNGSIVPPIDNWFDIGSSSKRWKDAYFAGTVNANTITANSMSVGSITQTGDLDMNNNDILHIASAYFGSSNNARLYWDGTKLVSTTSFSAPTIYQNGNQVLDTATSFNGDVSGTYNNLQIKAGAVGTNELANGAVTSAKIADGTITNTDLSNSLTFVSVQNSAGTQQFTVTNGNKALQLAGGTGISLSFDPANHRITITDANAGSEITGSGSANHVAKFNGANSLTDSQIIDDGTNVKIQPSGNVELQPSGNVKIEPNGDVKIGI